MNALRKAAESHTPTGFLNRKRIGLVALLAACLPALSHTVQAQSYSYSNAVIVGGGFVSGLIAHPTAQNLFYARTDVGGAYRWNNSNSTWIPLLDGIPDSTWWYEGVESFAIDPNDSSRLYLAVGEYVETYDGNGAILVSTNQGASFTTVPLPFRNGSNDSGRGSGERLVVDPNDSAILYFGSHQNGLWKSTNYGSSWSQVTIPNTGTSGSGVVWVAFDTASGSKGSPTPHIFIGVSDLSHNLYSSSNGGSSWSQVTGGPTNLYAHTGRLEASSRNLYMTYDDSTGPGGTNTGQVWRFNAGTSAWTNISPPNTTNSGGFSGVALDPEHTGTLVVTTLDHYNPGDTAYYSSNSGGSWADVGASATRNISISPWLSFGGTTAGWGNWPEGVIIDPFNSNRLFYGTGQTVYVTNNLLNVTKNQSVSFTVAASGIEETVPIALISPTTGPALISGVGDLGGFTHTSFTQSPAGGMNKNPIFGNGTGLDYAKSLATKIVRVGDSNVGQYGAYSTNSGSSWTPFSSQAGSSKGRGSVAISADGNTIVWAPDDVAPSYSTNNGSSWTSLSGSLPVGVTVLSDGVSNTLFYAYNPSTGAVYTSSNKGVSWYTASTGNPTGGRMVSVPGSSGGLWIAGGNGLYFSSNSGQTFSQFSGPTQAISVGFGKPDATGDYPTMFLLGTINGTFGIFRSVNFSTAWTRINDDNHQWGNPQFVIGDPRTFGTCYVGTPGRGIIVMSTSGTTGGGGGSSALVSGKTYTITNVNSKLLLEDPGSSNSTGVQMDQWPSNGGSNQKWVATATGANWIFTNVASGLVLEVYSASTTSGAVVDQYTANNGPNQAWALTAVGDGSYKIANQNSGLLVDVVSYSTSNGALIDQYTDTGGANQHWTFQQLN